MRVCDLIARFVYDSGVRVVFPMPGGGDKFLTDGFACLKELKKISCHHEQAAAMAAVGYAKYSNSMGCAVVTTGCGGTNTITSVLHAWQDGTACLFLSGQCNTRELIGSVPAKVRQVGSQEADIVTIVRSITKYAVTVMDPADILYCLEKARYLANQGRKGPVWIDVPINVQYADVDPDILEHFVPGEEDEEAVAGHARIDGMDENITYLKNHLREAKRPVVVAGQGIRLSGAVGEFQRFLETNDLPSVYTIMGLDALYQQHPLCIGKLGGTGTRAGNFAVQNADLLLVLGSRLSTGSTGYQYELFAREAEIIAVDINPEEHRKQTVKVDRVIPCDLKDFFDAMGRERITHQSDWSSTCRKWKETYPVCLPEHYEDADGISYYAFVNELSEMLGDDDVVVTDTGSALFVTSQGLLLKSSGQRFVTSGAQAEMGFTVPGAVGVCMARGRRRTVAVSGDGSLQMNLQELQTVVHNQLPIKLFVWNNDGYMSIRRMMKDSFEGRIIGTNAESGLSMPDLEKLAWAYGIPYIRLGKIKDAKTMIGKALDGDGPVICEVMCKSMEYPLSVVGTRLLEDGRKVSVPLEDMCPFLDREEFLGNLFVNPLY